ncbi:hypothetical protein HDU67_001342 [Dinochytrium kinnereticum]|nr:hypothetical protein HDU67_001342 [Dinochytrium kinnereticum]
MEADGLRKGSFGRFISKVKGVFCRRESQQDEPRLCEESPKTLEQQVSNLPNAQPPSETKRVRRSLTADPSLFTPRNVSFADTPASEQTEALSTSGRDRKQEAFVHRQCSVQTPVEAKQHGRNATAGADHTSSLTPRNGPFADNSASVREEMPSAPIATSAPSAPSATSAHQTQRVLSDYAKYDFLYMNSDEYLQRTAGSKSANITEDFKPYKSNSRSSSVFVRESTRCSKYSAGDRQSSVCSTDAVPHESSKAPTQGRHSVGGCRFIERAKLDLIHVESDEHLRKAHEQTKRSLSAFSEDGMLKLRKPTLVDSPASSANFTVNQRPRSKSIYSCKHSDQRQISSHLQSIDSNKHNDGKLPVYRGSGDMIPHSGNSRSVRRPSNVDKVPSFPSTSSFISISQNGRRYSELLDPKRMPLVCGNNTPQPGSLKPTPHTSITDDVMRAVEDQFMYMQTDEYKRSIASMKKASTISIAKEIVS